VQNRYSSYEARRGNCFAGNGLAAVKSTKLAEESPAPIVPVFLREQARLGLRIGADKGSKARRRGLVSGPFSCTG